MEKRKEIIMKIQDASSTNDFDELGTESNSRILRCVLTTV